MHDIPSLFSLNTSKTHEKHAKTHVTHWHARYSTTFQSKHEQNTRKACQNPRNSLTCTIFHHFSAKRPRKTRAISSFAGTCNTFPRVRTRALNKQTNKQTNKRTKREIEKRRRTWQARSSAPTPSLTIAEQWMSINVNSSKIKISSLVRRLSPRMEQAQQRAKQVDNRRQKRDLIQKMPLWGEINLKNVAYLTNNL